MYWNFKSQPFLYEHLGLIHTRDKKHAFLIVLFSEIGIALLKKCTFLEKVFF